MEGDGIGGLVKGMSYIKRSGIFVKDLHEFTKFLVLKRCLDSDNHVVQFGIDDRQGMLKVREIIKNTEPVEELQEKRSKYTDGACPTSAKFFPVNNFVVVGLVPQVQELYTNIKSNLGELNGKHFPFQRKLPKRVDNTDRDVIKNVDFDTAEKALPFVNC